MKTNLHVTTATASDWPILLPFYRRAYPHGHPLQNREFWEWQYGDAGHGSAFLVRDGEQVYGHVGVGFGDGIGWMMNLFIDDALRGQGWARRLYGAARERGRPLATTSANPLGLGMYRNMRWLRHANLERFIRIRPGRNLDDLDAVLAPIEAPPSPRPMAKLRYFEQPGITGLTLSDGSNGVAQAHVGGFRFVELCDVARAEEELWSLGFAWCDYVSSWNDHLLTQLEDRAWYHHESVRFPWYLNPVDPAKKCRITYLSEEPMPRDFVVKRNHCDHGRVGSL